jgi:hypothetical protein
MAHRWTVKRKLANGSFTRGNKRRATTESCRLCVDFPIEMFNDLRIVAQQQKCSMNEAVRLMVTWGTEAAGHEKAKI